MADFEQQKHRCLGQVDLSKKGSIDEHILELVEHINALANYFTTSSCSGRICVFSEDPGQKKKSGRWLFVSHNQIELQSLLPTLDISEGDAVFKFEPFVLHVQCRTLEDAQAMLRAALGSGYKNSGIVVGKKSRFILAVRSTQSLDVPIILRGKLLVSSEYIEYLVQLSNIKMQDNLTRIQRFFDTVKTLNTTDGSKALSTGKQKKENKRDHIQEKSRILQSDKEGCGNLDDENDIIESLSGFYEDQNS